MTDFVALTGLDGSPVWVNPSHIAVVRTRRTVDDRTSTLLEASSGYYWAVRETPARVVDLLQHGTGSGESRAADDFLRAAQVYVDRVWPVRLPEED